MPDSLRSARMAGPCSYAARIESSAILKSVCHLGRTVLGAIIHDDAANIRGRLIQNAFDSLHQAGTGAIQGIMTLTSDILHHPGVTLNCR